jgi:hypothetical protein
MKTPKSLKDRFFSKVLLPAPSKMEKDCWIWIGTKNSGGYGVIRVLKGQSMKLAHRLSYQFDKGLFNQSLCVLHKCNNPECVNPNHLYLGTRTDNHRYMVSQNRHAKGNAVALFEYRNANTKISKDVIRQIRSSKKPIKELSQLFGISLSYTYQIKNGNYRKHG